MARDRIPVELPYTEGLTTDWLAFAQSDGGAGVIAVRGVRYSNPPMASGAPVISACDGALPEVVGKAGPLLDADDPAEIVAAIKWLSSDLSASDAFRTMGAERAQVYR